MENTLEIRTQPIIDRIIAADMARFTTAMAEIPAPDLPGALVLYQRHLPDHFADWKGWVLRNHPDLGRYFFPPGG